ncbi:nucleotidyltransferase domain-containing protein [Tardisphaera miroshnichenkoae]
MQEPYASITDKLLEALKRHFGDNLISVVVFGSVARGDNRKDSDLDVLIVAKGLPEGQLERSKLFDEVEKELGDELAAASAKGFSVEISPIMKTPEEADGFSALYMDLTEDALILYDKGGFFSKVLEREREVLRKLGYERVRLGKAWYWRKRDYREGEVINYE